MVVNTARHDGKVSQVLKVVHMQYALLKKVCMKNIVRLVCPVPFIAYVVGWCTY